METFPALLALCAGNSPVSGEFAAQSPVTLSKVPWGSLYFFYFGNRKLWYSGRQAKFKFAWIIHLQENNINFVLSNSAICVWIVENLATMTILRFQCQPALSLIGPNYAMQCHRIWSTLTPYRHVASKPLREPVFMWTMSSVVVLLYSYDGNFIRNIQCSYDQNVFKIYIGNYNQNSQGTTW